MGFLMDATGEKMEKHERLSRLLVVLLFLLGLSGCAPAVIGAGATGAYQVGTDERTIGQMWDDATITTEVNTRLVKDAVTKARKIDVDTLQGVVLLTGVVETEAEAQRATKLASMVPGVKKVDNNLQVGTKTFGQALDDHVIGNKIKAKLIAEPGIRSFNIDVDVENGIVTLSGIVKTVAQKEKATVIARDTTGTVKVVDKIRVSGR